MKEELKEFGLTDNEARIYLELLKIGTSSPAEIATKTGFSRSYVYDALERMSEKRVVSSVRKNSKKNYSAIAPKQLEETAKQRLEKIQKIMPDLENLQNSSKDEIKVEVYKGKYIYKTLLKDITSSLKPNQEVLIFGVDDEAMIKLDQYYLIHLKQYFAKLQKRGIKEKVIAKTNAKIIKEAKTTTHKFLPKKIIGNTAFEVYGNKVAIFLWGDPNHLILIENKEVAESYRNQFLMMWNSIDVHSKNKNQQAL